ncbi:MAG TPA: DUF4245 domain-containing protein [Mycobacteriales bacterium]|nr:DUF4245 domain-containing protein [Mycobacteriales bacterium]
MSGDAPASDAAHSADVVVPVRPAKTFSDMARSLGLMAVVIAALLLLGPARTLVFPGSARMKPVDFRDQVSAFAKVAGSVLAPVGVPRSWRANAATFDSTGHTARLHIGFATPGSRFAGLDETNGAATPLVSRVLGARGSTVRGTTSIAGQTWQLRRSDRGEEALTTTIGGLTAVITGSATDQQLRTLAASLS